MNEYERKAAAAANYTATMNAIKAQLGDKVFAPPDSGRYYSKAYEKAEKRAWAAYQKACKGASAQ